MWWRVFLCLRFLCFFLFFKQKTAYEMRISDWSSDVCSSDLGISGLERRYTRFYHDANDAYASGDDATRSKTIAARFDALFPEAREPAALHALPNHDLR